ncbi:MAG: FAD-dependent oxidoreductase [Methanomassiliicoccales archaeon]|nr:FAD-dependent oxidoreductase [Methanomassiliicoccales archaeon]
MSDENVRIGVFVCHCGTNIGGFVDVPAVAKYAASLPDVAFASDSLYTCAENGLASIRDAIKDHGLNRVVVASCTPRTHAPLFQAVCEEAGLNKYLFTFVNIREQCSWVHMKEKEKATEKAKDLIRMGVARVRLLQAQEESRIAVEPKALVIGGGISGMTTALSLADHGFPVILVEKDGELGGFVRNLNNLYLDGKDAVETINPVIGRVRANRNITAFLNSRVVKVDGFIGNYDITLSVDGREKKDKVGVIVVATGAMEYVPYSLYGYEQFEHVVSLTEFEILCKNKALPKIHSIAFIQCVGSRGQDKSYCSRICCNVAIKNALNCAENYKNMLGREETGAEVKAPVEMKAWEEISERRRRRRGRRGEEEGGEAPQAAPTEALEITIFNRDVMAYGVDHELNYNKAREEHVRFVRYTPENLPKVNMEGDKLVVDYWHDTLKMQRKMNVDMVVLSTPLISQPDAKDLSKLLKVPLGQDGFFLEAHVKLRPVDFATDGVYVCGTAKAPADITECVDQALAAASRAAIPLARGYVQAEALTAKVNPDICTGCGTCEAVCPYGAIRKTEKGVAEVIVAACKGCGCCGATCPEGAIDQSHYTDVQLLAEAKAALEGVVH